MLRLFTLLIVAVAFIDAAVPWWEKSPYFSTTKPADNGHTCKPLNCGKIQCLYGHEIRKRCPTCVCFDPCNPFGKGVVCKSNQRCWVDQKQNGIYAAHCDASNPNYKNPACLQPKIVGPCHAALSRYYYDSKKGECTEFAYGGCESNDNNFGELELCEAACTS